MSDAIKPDITMDLKGLACPMPVVKVSQQIKKMQIGQVLAAETTDPGRACRFSRLGKKHRQ